MGREAVETTLPNMDAKRYLIPSVMSSFGMSLTCRFDHGLR